MKLYILLFLFFFANLSLAQNYDNTNYDLKYHNLRWTVDPAIYYIKGEVGSMFQIISETDNIVMELSNELKVDSIIYNSKEINFLHADAHLIIYFTKILAINTLHYITIYYQGKPSSTGNRSFVQDKHGDNIPIIWTLSEPMGAKDWWACKQTLNDKIDSIDIYIVAPKQYNVASNGILISEEINQEQKITHWKHKHLITPYLIAFAVTNYSIYSDFLVCMQNKNLEVLNYVYPEKIDYAKENTPKIAQTFQYYDSIFCAYPFERYGHAQFNFGGGMEHQTMSFMYNFSHSLMAHELAHQWFGNYITCGSWHDIWLNESFATYLDGLTVEKKLTTEITWQQWKQNRISEITSQNDGSVYVHDTTEHYSIFNYRMVYSKGAMVLNLLRSEIGDSLFFKAVQNYINDKELAYNFALTDDLIAHFKNVSNYDYDNFFNDWIFGEGYPIYEILWTKAENNLKVIVKQTTSHPSVDCFELKLPLLIKGKKDSLLILNNTSNYQEFNFEIDFYIDNIIFDMENNIITRGSFISEFFTSAKEFNIEIVSNPIKETLEISFPIEMKIKEITILNINGQIIKEEDPIFFGKKYIVQSLNLSAGVYIINLVTEKQSFSKKFIVSK